MTDVHTQEQRSYNMSRIKGKNTKPEKTLRSLLHMHGFRYRVHVSYLPGCPDIVLPKYKSVIFVHGCFWHLHSRCKYAATPKSRPEFWQEKLTGNVERDRKNITLLKKSGWYPIVVWECQLKRNADAVLEKVSTRLYRQYAMVGRE
jgi:DNA mismatch endonuclease (patch repair protein)